MKYKKKNPEKYIKFKVSKEKFFSIVAENMYKTDGIEIEDICTKICLLFNGLLSRPTIQKTIPEQYKNIIMASNRLGKSGYTKKRSIKIKKSPI